MSEYERKLKNQRHAFLLTFFADQTDDHYEAREVNGFVLVKQWNGNCNEWQVAIYTKESYGITESAGLGQTSPKPAEKQPMGLYDGGSETALQDVSGNTRPLPWETEGETSNR